jgi:hypothetical protein
MFIDKKYLFALTLVPLAIGCVVDDGDDDDGTTNASTTGGTGTDTTNGTMSTSSTTAGTGTDTTGGTDTDSGTADTGTGTDTGGDGMACFFACEAAEDCCAFFGPTVEPTCIDGLGSFPWDVTCDAEGFCVGDPGCSEDQQCDDQGLGQDLCVDGSCQTSCEEDMDCDPGGTTGFTCTGGGGTYCEAPGCEEDMDCGPDLICVDGGCEFPSCEEDADCADQGPGGVCDTATGECGCMDDAECAEGFGCGSI